MKKLAILLLCTFSLAATAQSKTSTSRADVKQTVKDDGKTLHITIKSNKAGKEVNYDHTFSVERLNQKQKDALVKRVTDSLGINPPPAPPPHH